MLRPTPWRMLLEFHLIDFAFMSAEHDVSAKPISRKVPTKRHTVSYKLSRWDASVSTYSVWHYCMSIRREGALAHSNILHLPSLISYYNIIVFLVIAFIYTFILLFIPVCHNLRPHRCPHTLTVWFRYFLVSMVEYIDYGQEASRSKARHEHSVITDGEEFIIVVLAVGACKTFPPNCFTASPHTNTNHVAVLKRFFHW